MAVSSGKTKSLVASELEDSIFGWFNDAFVEIDDRSRTTAGNYVVASQKVIESLEENACYRLQEHENTIDLYYIDVD